MNKREMVWAVLLTTFAIFYFGYGYLYNDAKKQALDIKSCQSVGADWRYSDSNQVLCVKAKKECRGYE